MKTDFLRVLLVGLGKVGMGYDINAPKNQILSHLKSIVTWEQKTNIKCEIIGIDLRPETKKDFNTIAPNGIWLNSINEARNLKNVNLAIVATPILTITQDVLDLHRVLAIRKIVVEKPAAKSIKELNLLKNLEYDGTKLLVAFPRPHLESSLHIKNLVKSYGKSQNWEIKIMYGGTIMNILSHFLNLVEYWFGEFNYSLHYFDTNGNLNAEFNSKDGRIKIITKNYSKINDENNFIEISGPVNISYVSSGRKIYVKSSPSNLKGIDNFLDCSSDIEQMIGISGSNYFHWALGGELGVTKISSNALYETIKLADSINEV